MIFSKLEPLIGENLPECVKKILIFCGYDTITSMKSISAQDVKDIEILVRNESSGRELIQSLNCCYSKDYREQDEFHFLPGHKSVILALPRIVHEYQHQNFIIPSYFSYVLRELISTAVNNRENLRPVYSEAIKSFATFLFLKCGRSCYEFLYKNLPLPCINTICKFIDHLSIIVANDNFDCITVNRIDQSKERMIEGQLRTKELSEYLDRMKTPRLVWLSEDATAIVSKVKYDPKTNQMVGLLLPLDEKNGCPIPFSFLAANADLIELQLKETMSHSVYVVMAQPLDEKVPPFVLQMFGTTQRFKSTDVIKRWKYTKSELER